MTNKTLSSLLIISLATSVLGCGSNQQISASIPGSTPSAALVAKIVVKSPKIQKIIDNAIEQTKVTRSYDPAYVKLAYPDGDVPLNTGVCTDVVIRAFRAIDIDFQKEVHEDMKKNFNLYPRNWGLNAPDTNIDHRRVPNLMVWLKRQGKSLPLSKNGKDFLPGDIVTWDLGGGQQHIGLVSNIPAGGDRLAIIHNISSGAKAEDVLLSWKMIGHYRYLPYS